MNTEKYLKLNKIIKKKVKGNRKKKKIAKYEELEDLKIEEKMKNGMKQIIADLGSVMNRHVLKSILDILFSKEEKWVEEIMVAAATTDLKNELEKSKLNKYKKVILKYLKTRNNEISIIFKVRFYASIGKAEKALKIAKKALKQGLEPNLEFVYPSLIAFGELHHIPNIFEIEKLCDEYNITLTENQYKYIFQAFQNFGVVEDFFRFLEKAGNEIRAISETTLNYIQERFKNENKKNHMPDWQIIKEITINNEGRCKELKGRLIKRHRAEIEWNELIEYIEAYIINKLEDDNPKPFKEFIEWYDTNGPYDIILDGANIINYDVCQEENSDAVDLKNLEIMIRKIEREFQDEKILVILNVNRLYGREALTLYGRDLLDQIRVKDRLYETPTNQNDDYFLIYAALKAKNRGLIITNDNFKDHWSDVNQNRHIFQNWSKNHTIKFSVKKEEYCVNLKLPELDIKSEDYYIQRLKNDTWLFPVQSTENVDKIYWSCIKYIPDIEDEFFDIKIDI